MKSTFLFVLAAFAEISGCFAFYAWWRLEKPAWWLAPGLLFLVLFAWLLSLVDSNAAGRTFAAYGGLYVAASLLWLYLVEGKAPDRFDLAGGALCLIGCAVILFAPRSS
ncbi:small multidrug resistance family-3 protein [Neorhizobium galegae]|uniref:YnfA family protein n=1 Tax=Rhizobium/Agrobacterium group TaxID=227290 RepID=UPI001AE90EED|nr:YnfA family protein [Neorhizobium galegae]MBP2547424.1 small multidrug resistance family-3 protein [Neorhizobium galegae]